MRNPLSARHGLTLFLVLASLIGAGCSSLRGAGMGMGPAPAAVVVAARLTQADRDFLTKAAAKGMYEVEVSRLAAERAVNPRVRSYAQMLVAHHTRVNSDLVSLMSTKGVAPPSGLAADKATKLHRLAGLKPSAEFDLGYVRVVGIEDHQANIASFERARRETRDRDVRDWIDKTLPTLRSHLSAAQSIVGGLAG